MILYLLFTIFFAGNITADDYKEYKDELGIYGIAGLVPIFFIYCAIWPIIVSRNIWKKYF